MITFQEILRRISAFWEKQGCIIQQGYDLEVGAGTFNPATFLRCLGPEPYRTAYIEPSRRPADGRFGINPNRLQHFFQYQVILKPSPLNLQELYLESLEAIGFNIKEHDIRFVHDDWESPTLGAWGLGWEVWMDGMEVTQFTYFQSVGGVPLNPITGELTYGIERLAMYLQKVDSIFDIQWSPDLTYGDIYQQNEYEFTHYNFDAADTTMWLRHFEDYEREATKLIEARLPLPAYDFIMKASHAFNMLDARGVISVTERTGYIGRIRTLSCRIAEAYVESRKEMKYPLMGRFACKKREEEHLSPVTSKINEKLLNATPEMRDDYLIEIGSEELPASFVTIGCASFERLLRAMFEEAGIPFESIDMYGTPRRIAAYVRKLAMASKSKSEERRGPEIAAAFGSDGELKPPGRGFLRSIHKEQLNLSAIRNGKDPAVTIKEHNGKEYLFARIVEKSRSTADILSEKMPDLILSIDFPKKMRWSDLEISYARPIRWIASLLGSHTVPFTVGNITACRKSHGHSQLHPWSFALVKAKDYLPLLRDHYVIADMGERRKSIVSQLDTLEKTLGGKIIARDRLLAEVTNLVEWPRVTHATFDKKHLAAPKEVLISEMVEHQRYFPVEKEDGTLKNVFVITANIPPTGCVGIGNQRALSPRLADGVALYEQDLKVSFDSLNEKLKQVTFQKELGSVYEKVERLKAHAACLQQLLAIGDSKMAESAASYCKADLASRMVYEFPELQGTMGRYYALAHGLDQEVAIAIEEHWMPRGEKAPLPETATGIILSLADKIDNLLGCFAVGLKPTSSSDPYALRRQVLGMIKILIEKQLSLPFEEAFSTCLAHFPDAMKSGGAESLAEIKAFFINRIKSVFLDYGFRKDEIEASLSTGFYDIYDSYCKVDALHRFRQEGNQFPLLFEVYKRAKGQLHAGNKSTDFTEELMSEQAERALHNHLEETEQSFQQAMRSHRYHDAYTLISQIQKPLATLFDEVKILAEEPAVQNNRLALLANVFHRFDKLLDFSKIQE